jgi:uncharacterized protein YbjT (DUF2867 family)
MTSVDEQRKKELVLVTGGTGFIGGRTIVELLRRGYRRKPGSRWRDMGHRLGAARGNRGRPRYGGWLNNDLADYVVPVNADVGEIEVAFIDRPDPLLNATGAKGLGEVALAGASGAIANAIFHATGRRIRRMPIRIEHLL